MEIVLFNPCNVYRADIGIGRHMVLGQIIIHYPAKPGIVRSHFMKARLMPQTMPPMNWLRAVLAFRIFPAPKTPVIRAT